MTKIDKIKIKSEFGALISYYNSFIPLWKISNKYETYSKVQTWTFGWHSRDPLILVNKSNKLLQIQNRDTECINLHSRVPSVRAGARNEKPTLRLTILESGKYLLIVKFFSIVAGAKNMELGISINGKPIWISVSPDCFVGYLSVVQNDTVDVFAGVLSGYNYLDATIAIQYALYLSLQGQPLSLRMKDSKSSLSDEEANLILKEYPYIRSFQELPGPVEGSNFRQGTWIGLAGQILSKHFLAGFEKDNISNLLEEIESQSCYSPQKKYIILFTPRSGSTYLTECLGRTKKLGFPTEFLSEHIYVTCLSLRYKEQLSPLEFLVNKFSSQNGVFGIEIDFERLFLSSQTPIKKLNEWKIIYYTRQNMLAQAISLYTARIYYSWSIHHIQSGKPFYNRKEILATLCYLVEQEEAFEKYFFENKIDPLRLSYEEFISNKQETIKKIAEYLDVTDVCYGELEDNVNSVGRLSNKFSYQWMIEILCYGGTYKGYDIFPIGDGYRAILAGADVSRISDPIVYPPLAIYGASIRQLENYINQIINIFIALEGSDEFITPIDFLKILRCLKTEVNLFSDHECNVSQHTSSYTNTYDINANRDRYITELALSLDLLARDPDVLDGYKKLADSMEELAGIHVASLIAEVAKTKFLGDPWPWEASANYAMRDHKYEIAWQNAKYLTNFHKDLNQGYWLRVISARMMNNLQDASDTVQSAYNLFPDYAWPLMEKGWIAISKGEISNVFDIIKEIELRFPNYTEKNALLVTALRVNGQFEEALNVTFHCIHIHKLEKWVYQEIILNLIGAGRFEEAQILAWETTILFDNNEWSMTMLNDALLVINNKSNIGLLTEESIADLRLSYPKLPSLLKLSKI